MTSSREEECAGARRLSPPHRTKGNVRPLHARVPASEPDPRGPLHRPGDLFPRCSVLSTTSQTALPQTRAPGSPSLGAYWNASSAKPALTITAESASLPESPQGAAMPPLERLHPGIVCLSVTSTVTSSGPRRSSSTGTWQMQPDTQLTCGINKRLRVGLSPTHLGPRLVRSRTSSLISFAPWASGHPREEGVGGHGSNAQHTQPLS